MVSRAVTWLVTLSALTFALTPSSSRASDAASRLAATASLANPHTLDLELDYRAARRTRALTQEPTSLLDLSPELRPLRWPRSSDMRARLLTPELQRTPLVGWIATNLYRPRSETGWCLELDPGEGEYLVLYRRHL